MTFSTNNGFIQKNHMWHNQCSPCLCESVTGRRPATSSHKHGICPAFLPSTGLHVMHRKTLLAFAEAPGSERCFVFRLDMPRGWTSVDVPEGWLKVIRVSAHLRTSGQDQTRGRSASCQQLQRCPVGKQPKNLLLLLSVKQTIQFHECRGIQTTLWPMLRSVC